MLQANTIITESLSPAVAISGIGLLFISLNTRISTLASRVRDLNKEFIKVENQQRRDNIRRQIPLFLKRAKIIRISMFTLLGALGLMVFSAVALALSKLGYVHWVLVPAWSFLGGLMLMLVAVVMEAYETSLKMTTLEVDVEMIVEP